MLDNVGWEITDLKRDLAKRRGREDLQEDVVEEVNLRGMDTEPPMVEEAEALNKRIQGLSPRDRQIAVGRMFLGREPADLAADLGMSRSAFDTAYHRMLGRLAVSDDLEDERNRRRAPEE